jgi:hypothetical protein
VTGNGTQIRTPDDDLAEVMGVHENAWSQPFKLIAVRDIPEIITQDWLIEGLIPRYPNDGCAGYLFTPAKGRKSMLLSDIALSVSSGTPALGRFAVKRQGTAVGFFAEDPKGETSRRAHRQARARGIEVPPNFYLIDTPTIAIDSPEHQERLLATLKGVPDLAFVWFDPMIRFHRVNDNKAEELGPIHTFLRGLARQCPAAVFLLAHHTNHEGGPRGSTEYSAFGDFNLYGRKKNQITTEIYEIENRGGPPGKPFMFSVEDGASAGGPTLRLVAEDCEKVERSENTAIEEVLVAFRDSNPKATVKEGKQHLKALGIRCGSDKFWELWKDARR